jgi:hypothetical protein
MRGGAVQKTARIAKCPFGDKSDFAPCGGPVVIANRCRLCGELVQHRHRVSTEAVHHFSGDLFYSFLVRRHTAPTG